jgi:hypothetical protein
MSTHKLDLVPSFLTPRLRSAQEVSINKVVQVRFYFFLRKLVYFDRDEGIEVLEALQSSQTQVIQT